MDIQSKQIHTPPVVRKGKAGLWLNVIANLFLLKSRPKVPRLQSASEKSFTLSIDLRNYPELYRKTVSVNVASNAQSKNEMFLSGSTGLASTWWLFAELLVWDKCSVDICEPLGTAMAA